jgi:hypothetical protein
VSSLADVSWLNVSRPLLPGYYTFEALNTENVKNALNPTAQYIFTGTNNVIIEVINSSDPLNVKDGKDGVQLNMGEYLTVRIINHYVQQTIQPPLVWPPIWPGGPSEKPWTPPPVPWYDTQPRRSIPASDGVWEFGGAVTIAPLMPNIEEEIKAELPNPITGGC